MPIAKPTPHQDADLAARCARAAGDLLRSRFGTVFQVAHKGATDLVTEMDLASERLIRDFLAAERPGDGVFGEEGGGQDFHAGRVWVFDPLDGTTNFAHGLPIFSVSIALCVDGRPRAGAIYQPMTNECFLAWEGGGAWRNGQSICVSGNADLERALVVTGFPYVIGPVLEPTLARLREMMVASQGVRRLGSAAMDLCYVGAGIFDVFWETGLKPYDVAAGMLLVTEAGGNVTDFCGGPRLLDGEEILATNGSLHDRMVALLGPSVTAPMGT